MNEFDFAGFPDESLVKEYRVHQKFLNALSKCVDYNDKDEDYKKVVLQFRNDVTDYCTAMKKELKERNIEVASIVKTGDAKSLGIGTKK